MLCVDELGSECVIEFVMFNINLIGVNIGFINDLVIFMSWLMLLRSVSKKFYFFRLIVVICVYIVILVDLLGLFEGDEGVLCFIICLWIENGIRLY